MTGFDMKLSNFEGGFMQGVLIRGMPIQVTHPGKVFWVGNSTAAATVPNRKTASDSNKGTFLAPFSTVNYAFSQCVASRGDIVMVLPGHAETFSAADGFDMNVAGVAMVGLGQGSLRPTFTFDTATTADCNISAANCAIYNCVFSANFADIVRCVQITAKNAALVNCEWTDTAVNMNWLSPIKATSTTDNNADGLWVEGCKWYSPDAAGLEFIEINATIQGFVCLRNYMVHEGTTNATLIFNATGKNFLGADIRWNHISTKITAGNLFIESDSTASTGIAAHNKFGHADTTGTHDNGLTGMGFRLFDNLSTSTASVSGFLLPAADSDA